MQIAKDQGEADHAKAGAAGKEGPVGIAGGQPPDPRHLPLGANSMAAAERWHADGGSGESRGVFLPPGHYATAATQPCPLHAAGSKRQMPGFQGQSP